MKPPREIPSGFSKATPAREWQPSDRVRKVGTGALGTVRAVFPGYVVVAWDGGIPTRVFPDAIHPA